MKFRCSECGKEYKAEADRMLCSECSKDQRENRPLRGILEVTLDVELPSSLLEQVRRECASRREANEGGLQTSGGARLPARGLSPAGAEFVRRLLPIDSSFLPPLPVGETPLWKPPRLAEKLGRRELYLKDDTANPTGSLKDRASFLVAGWARELGIDRITVASTGNAASSMAGVGAAAGLDITIFLPATAPRAKLVQGLQYGARVIPVEGTYDEAFDRSLAYSREHGGMSRNTAYNPMTIEGKKTAALEIFLQFGGVPDYVFVPTGDGVILSGIYRGFEDLVRTGAADRMPGIVAVQAEGSASICRALETGDFSDPVSSDTCCDSISVNVPRGGCFALGRLSKHGGGCIRVSDDQALQAQMELSSGAGLFAEPSSAAALAGLRVFEKEIPEDASVVLLITGNGLKDIDGASKKMEFPI
ncbi:MAG: threonine synthase [Spirochaetales bacterium]|nr:threonine synthase [Spirochaetales bacterium]MCF7938466.1 threonine synthase [Spirochaetales bacterium]